MPGCTEFTRTPSSPKLVGGDSHELVDRGLARAVAARYRHEKTAAVDEMATNEPPPARTIARPAYFSNRNTGRTFWSTSSLNWSSP